MRFRRNTFSVGILVRKGIARRFGVVRHQQQKTNKKNEPIKKVTRVTFDANLSAAIGRKHAKYDPWLLRNPCASIARLVPGARDPHSWTFDPLVVVAIGVWGTVSHSTVAALTALGLSVAPANAALGAALESIAHDNMLISRLRHSSPTRWRGA